MGNLSARSRMPTGAEKYGEDDDFLLSTVDINCKLIMSDIPYEVQVAHFMPANFPLIPIINRRVHKKCSESWSFVISQDVYDSENERNVSSMTAFYTEFYDQLKVFDADGKFDAVLTAHSSKQQSKIAARGAIILRVVQSCLKMQSDNEENRKYLALLGKIHGKMRIRPWMYSIFVQTLLNTIASRLGPKASPEVMSSWVNLFAYVMKYMMPLAIKNHVNMKETFLTPATFTTDPAKLAEWASMRDVSLTSARDKSARDADGSRQRSSPERLSFMFGALIAGSGLGSARGSGNMIDGTDPAVPKRGSFFAGSRTSNSNTSAATAPAGTGSKTNTAALNEIISKTSSIDAGTKSVILQVGSGKSSRAPSPKRRDIIPPGDNRSPLIARSYEVSSSYASAPITSTSIYVNQDHSEEASLHLQPPTGESARKGPAAATTATAGLGNTFVGRFAEREDFQPLTRTGSFGSVKSSRVVAEQ